MRKRKFISLVLTFAILFGVVTPVNFVDSAGGDGEYVVFDMQSVADLTPLATRGTTIKYIDKKNGTDTAYAVKNTAPKTVTVTGRSGTSHGLAINVADIMVFAGHTYEIGYSGTFPDPANATAVARIRNETGSAELATATAVNGNFTVTLTRTAAQIEADSGSIYSLANKTGSMDIVYTGISIKRICPASCGGVCESAVSSADFTNITLTPGGDETQMNVSWFTPVGHTPAAAIVQLAKASEVIDGIIMPSTAKNVTGKNGEGTTLFDSNRASLTGLVADTEYAYRVGDGTNWSPIYKFKTADLSSYQILVTADPQMGSSNSRAEQLRKTMKEAVSKNPKIAFGVIAGDITGDIDSKTADPMKPINAVLSPPELRSVPMAAVYGNHDHDARIGGKIVLPYMFNWPNASEINSGSKGLGHAYYFKYGDILFICPDSEIDDVSKGSVNYKTFENAVAAYPNTKWRIAVFHHDYYGAGSHANRKGTNDTPDRRKNWGPVVDEFKIDLVINGHDHNYVRSSFMKGDKAQAQPMPATYGKKPEGTFTKGTTEPSVDGKNTPTSDGANPGTFVNPVGTMHIVPGSTDDVDKYGLYLNDYLTPEIRRYKEEDGNTTYESSVPRLDATAWVAHFHHFNPAGVGLNKSVYGVLDVEGDNITFKAYWNTDEKTNKWDMIDSITLSKQARKQDLAELVKTMPGTSAAKTAAETVLAGKDVHAPQYHNLFISMYAAKDKNHNCDNPGHKCATCGLGSCGGSCTICNDTCKIQNCQVCDPCPYLPNHSADKCGDICKHPGCNKIYLCGVCDDCTAQPGEFEFKWQGNPKDLPVADTYIRKVKVDVGQKFKSVTSVGDVNVTFDPGGAGGSASGRYLWIWTDLVGTPTTAHASSATLTANRAMYNEIVMADTSTSFNIPLAYIYDAQQNKFATELYFLSTTKNKDPNTGTSGLRNDVVDKIISVKLTVNGLLKSNPDCVCGLMCCSDCKGTTKCNDTSCTICYGASTTAPIVTTAPPSTTTPPEGTTAPPDTTTAPPDTTADPCANGHLFVPADGCQVTCERAGCNVKSPKCGLMGCPNCDSSFCNVCKEFGCVLVHEGYVANNEMITLSDALEVLMYLANMETSVLNGNERAMKASLITPQSKLSGEPSIADVMEILMYIAYMPSKLGQREYP